ncbi:MAG: MFS transporter, partial [Actinobacteria bacterium]|nr:MFS transporter [Actinomycetota bacterium]
AIQLGAVGGLAACTVGITWVMVSGRLHRHESKRFRLTIDETRPLEIVSPEEFSDEVAATTPIPLPGERPIIIAREQALRPTPHRG